MFTLPPLPYAPDALEPVLDQKTMLIHHDRHHATYVQKLNDALVDQPENEWKLEDLLLRIDDVNENIRPAVRNHAGGHHNHTLFWESLSATPGQASDTLQELVRGGYGSMEELKTEMFAQGAALFGSGWVWLVERDGEVQIMTTSNQDSPLMQHARPLLGIDVWEHAYYLKYQNKRPDYLEAIWTLIDWAVVSRRLDEALDA